MRGGDAHGQTVQGIYTAIDGVGETTATDRSTRTGDDGGGAHAWASARAKAASAAPRRAAALLASRRAAAPARRAAAARANRCRAGIGGGAASARRRGVSLSRGGRTVFCQSAPKCARRPPPK